MLWKRWKREVAGQTKENLTEVEMKEEKTLEGTTGKDEERSEMC